MRYCKEPNCLNEAVKNRLICHKCKTRKYRAANRVKSLYHINKHNAKRRGIEWNITIDEWIIFCAETNYHKLVGLGAEDMTVDRKRSWEGYSYDNIQMITRSANTSKRHKDAKNRITHWKPVLKGDPNIPF